MNSRKKFEWNRECMYLRRSGKDEISWEEFLEKQKQLPFITKLNKKRKNYAKFFYIDAGFDFASMFKLYYMVRKLTKQKT